MTDLEFDLPKNGSSIIKVLGIGGGGSNAVSYMYEQGIKGVDFIVCNTDAQALELSPVPTKIQLGKRGLGAGSVPEIGRIATLEQIDQINEIFQVNTKMLFITAGMGGGTGTGGAPVIAQAARESGILTVGIVTLPFSFEGRKRCQQAEAGIEEMRKYVDALLLISNDKLRELYGNLKLSEAFNRADDILTTAAKGIAEIITMEGYVNVDFEDVKTVLTNSGKAIMGSDTADGEDRASKVVKGALNSPLLNDNSIKGADNILLQINSGEDEISVDEINEITEYIQNEAGQSAQILWGYARNPELGSKISVTVVATGFNRKKSEHPKIEKKIVGVVADSNIIEKEHIEIRPDEEITSEPDNQLISLFDQISEPVVKRSESETMKLFPDEEGKLEESSLMKEEEDNILKFEIDSPKLKQTENTIQDTDEDRIFASVSKPVESSETEDTDLLRKQSEERIQRLKSLSMKMKTPAGLSELENEPAYKRVNFELKDPPPNVGLQASRYVLDVDEENNTEIRSNNAYLYDNPD